MRKLTAAMTLAFAMGAFATNVQAMGCEYGAHSKKNDLEPPPPATAAVKPKKQDS